MSFCPLSHARSWVLAVGTTLLLAACASGPDDQTLIPAELGEQTQQQGWFTQPVQWTHQRPGCRKQCATLVVNSLAFPGHERLTARVDHALAAMTWLDDQRPVPYEDIEGYERYMWKTAGAHDETTLTARARYRNAHLTVVELEVDQYHTGMAHGISGSRFLIWDHAADRALALDDLLEPGRRGAFEALLRKAHAQWLKDSPAAQADPENFGRMWPFAPSDNVALTDEGVVVKYQPYQIAPYAAGKPELLLPYAELHGVLKPRFLPRT